MNSSDEAALRFTLVNAMVCYLAKGREPKMEDAPAAAVEATAAVDAFAAAVRAEAVADERRRTLEWALAKAEDEVAVGDESWFQPEHGESATECTVRFIKALLAAGSVPVATPPAEPAAPRLWPCEHGERGWHRTDDNRHCLGGAAPSQPVTCKWHGYAHRHYVGASAATGGYWCPGPVSVPKESSE